MASRAAFSWDRMRAELSGLPGGQGLNIAHEAVDRHVAAGRRDRVALRLLGKDGSRREVTYGELEMRTNQFANMLAAEGIVAGDVIVILCGRDLDLSVAVLGALKQRCVGSSVFSAFGPEPIKARLQLSNAKALFTMPALYGRHAHRQPSRTPAQRNGEAHRGFGSESMVHFGLDAGYSSAPDVACRVVR